MNRNIVDLAGFNDDGSQIGGRAVKSALRCIQILEILHSTRIGLRLRDISKLMHSPNSSVDYILKTLVETGHVHYSMEDRTYRLSPRIGLLGNWVDPMLIADGPILRAMRELHDATGHYVSLATPNGMMAEFIHVEIGDHPRETIALVGRSVSLLRSPVGIVLLTLVPDREIANIVRRHNAAPDHQAEPVQLDRLKADIETIRQQGHAVKLGPQGWVLAIPLYRRGGSPLAILLGTPASAEDIDVTSLLSRYQEIFSKLPVA